MKYVAFDPNTGKDVRPATSEEIDLFVEQQCDEYRAAVNKGDYRLAAWLVKTVWTTDGLLVDTAFDTLTK